MLDLSVLNICFSVIGIYNVCLAVFGTIGSVFVIVIAYKLRDSTTFVFIVFLALTDALALYWWNLDDFLTIYFGISLQEDTIYGCRIETFFEFMSMQASAWLLVMISVDRFLSVKHKTWTRIFKPKQAFIASAANLAFFSILNFNVWFTYGARIYDQNGTYTDYCHSEKTPNIEFMAMWNTVNSFMYAYIPYTALIIANSALIIYLKIQHKKRISAIQSKSKKNSNVSRTVIWITLLFIVFTCPSSINGIFFDSWWITDWGRLLIYLGDSTKFSYHALSFPILLASNVRFRTKFYTILSSLGICVRNAIQAKSQATRET